MKPELILRSDLLDILFEHRNKAYGAYRLRRLYNSHLMAGLGGMVIFSVGLWLLSPKFNGGGNVLNAIPIFASDTVFLSPPPDLTQPPPPPPPPPVHQKMATIAFTIPKIDPDVPYTETPDQEQLVENRIGTETRAGDPDNGEPTGPANSITGTAPAAPITPPMEEAPEILKTASVMPQFPGGEAALQRWLSRQLKPQEDQEPGQRIKVVVRFVVGKNGEIGQVELVQQGGEAFDREVLRVINKMPRWEAGHHNGKTVAVWFSIPVIFEMPEQ